MKKVILLITEIFIINILVEAQNQPQSEGYTYGVFSHLSTSANYPRAKAYLDSAGFNNIVDGIVLDTTTSLNQSLIGIKEESPEDYISYYSKGYYSKWEAENEEFAFGRVWFKHPYKIDTNYYNHYVLGQVETHQGAVCWATYREVGYWIDSVLWGPHYHQDKYYDFSFWEPDPKITYITSYRLAFSNIPQKSLDTEVCRLKVTYSYRYGEYPDTHIVVKELSSKSLRVRDFPSDESFRNFTISYQLPDRPTFKDRRLPENWVASADTVYEDDVPLAGVEFKLEWSGIGKLYIDYVEVYDSLIWGKDFIDPSDREITINRIKTYALNHQNITKLKYWYVNDEPNSIDTYLPMRIVDSLVNSVTPGKNTITEIYPHWRGELNGEHHLKQFVQISNTKKLMIDMFPAYVDQPYWEGIDNLRNSLQWAWEAQPNFWYVAQAFGQQKNDGTYCQWRRITPTELNASLLLALSHGAKGIFFWHYQPNYSNDTVAICDSQIVYFSALLNSSDQPTELYDYLRFNFSPRIKGHLGETLNKLSYTGNFITRKYIHPTTELFPEPRTFEYLTISRNEAPSKDIYWHVGFLADSSNLLYNKYFLLTNLITTYPQRNIRIDLTKPVDGFYNYRFRNAEPQFNFDTTYQNTFTTIFTFPAGEGYLFQVAPVVRFGGKLYYNDTIKTNTELIEDMWIKNNVNLIIERGKYYTIKDTVTLEGTGFITGKGYLNIGQGGDIKINSWNKSVFKGREGNHPKIIWDRYPTNGRVTSYKIYRAKGNNQFIQIANVDSTQRHYILTQLQLFTTNRERI